MMTNYQAAEVKCNFCFNWCSVPALRCSLSLCDSCFSKAIDSKCFKVTSPIDRNVYQVYLYKTGVSELPDYPSASQYGLDNIQPAETIKNLIDNVDDTFTNLIKEVITKWESSKVDVLKDKNAVESLLKRLEKGIDWNCSLRQQKTANKANESGIWEIASPTRRPLDTIHESVYLNNTAKTVQSGTNKKSRRKTEPGIDDAENYDPTNTKDDPNNNNNNYYQYNNKRRTRKESSAGLNSRVQTSMFLPNLENSQKYTSNQKRGGNQGHTSKRSNFSKYKSELQANLVNPVNQLKCKIAQMLESSKYQGIASRIMVEKIYEALQNTYNRQGVIELVAWNIQHIDFGAYLSLLDWKDVEVVKFVKIGMRAEHLQKLLDVLGERKSVLTLVLSNNRLDEEALELLARRREGIKHVQNIYLAKNIFYNPRVKHIIRAMKQDFSLFV